MKRVERPAEEKAKMREIVRGNNREDAIEQLIENDICVSKAEAKRLFTQLGGKDASST